MTPTEKAKRSDALYYETVSVTRRVLCDMIANREADIDDLRTAARLMWQRLRWADETMGCGVLDRRFERRMRELGVEVDG